MESIIQIPYFNEVEHLSETLVAPTGPVKGIAPIEFVANQDNYKFPSQPPENFANNRRYPSAARQEEWESWSDVEKALADEPCHSVFLKCDYASMVGQGARAA